MIVVAALCAAAASAVPAAGASSPGRAQVMIVGRTAVLMPARTVSLGGQTVTVSGRRCAVAAATPLSVLAAARRAGGPPFSLRDYAHCSRSARNAQSLFVTRIGPDRNAGQNGWVYKVGNRSGTTDAASLSGAFGDGHRLRAGQRVLWFWCVMGARGCQRTLAVAGPAAAAPGAALTLTVTGYDDQGRGTPAAGATVTLGGATATTDASGRATLAAPPTAGTYQASATQPGAVPSFPQAVRIA